jgi:hypothetical protein
MDSLNTKLCFFCINLSHFPLLTHSLTAVNMIVDVVGGYVRDAAAAGRVKELMQLMREWASEGGAVLDQADLQVSE